MEALRRMLDGAPFTTIVDPSEPFPIYASVLLDLRPNLFLRFGEDGVPVLTRECYPEAGTQSEALPEEGLVVIYTTGYNNVWARGLMGRLLKTLEGRVVLVDYLPLHLSVRTVFEKSTFEWFEMVHGVEAMSPPCPLMAMSSLSFFRKMSPEHREELLAGYEGVRFPMSPDPDSEMSSTESTDMGAYVRHFNSHACWGAHRFLGCLAALPFSTFSVEELEQIRGACVPYQDYLDGRIPLGSRADETELVMRWALVPLASGGYELKGALREHLLTNYGLPLESTFQSCREIFSRRAPEVVRLLESAEGVSPCASLTPQELSYIDAYRRGSGSRPEWLTLRG